MCAGSGDPQRTEAKFVAAAVKIQKAVRGFLVKKNVRTVRKAAADAERIALLVTRKADSIRHDKRERLRVGEMLMALLLRLDSARGVREYRKKVVRRVVRLQEAVDCIIAAAMSPASPIPKVERKEVIGIECIPESDIDGRDQVKELEEASENQQPSNVTAEKSLTEGGEDQVEEIKEVMGKGRIIESSSAIQVQGMMEMMQRIEGLMKELHEQSAQHCGLVGELVQRVEQLEKKVQRMDRRKRLVQRIEQLEQKVQQLRRRKRKRKKAGDPLACSRNKKIARKI